MPSGPRIHIKTDGESGIGRGCHLYADHFQPAIAAIFEVVGKTAPPNVSDIKFSEGHRQIRNTRDLHQTCEALDVSADVLLDGATEWKQLHPDFIMAWAVRIADKLGDDFDVVVHGDGANLHIHIEYDPK